MPSIGGPLRNSDQVGSRALFSGLPYAAGDPDVIVYFNDFLVAADYAAADWVVTTTEGGAGDAAETLVPDVKGGALLLTNDAASADLDALQSTEEFIQLVPGKKVWFETRVKVDSAALVNFMIGASITDTTMLDSSDRVSFRVTSGSAAISAITALASTATTTSAVGTIVSNTYIKLGFYFDGASVRFFVDRVLVATHTTNIPTVPLALSVHIQNGSAVIRTATIDYFYVAMER